MTPVVSWELIEPAKPWPAPTLDHPEVTTIAIAAIWPSGIRPSGIRLIRFGDAPTVPGARPSSSPLPGLGSGWFYTPVGLTSDVVAWPGLGWPGSWPTHGWPPGVYAFEVDLAGTTRVSLPFVIAAGGAS